MYESRRPGITTRLAAMRLYYSALSSAEYWKSRGKPREAQQSIEHAKKCLKIAKRQL